MRPFSSLLFAAILIWISATPARSVQVTVVPDSVYQRVEAFGGALCFFEDALAQLPARDRDVTLRRLFLDLPVRMVRVRIKPGVEPSNDNDNPDSTNWDGVSLPDTFAVQLLNEARALGGNFRVLAAAWSPPAWMKDNGQTGGGGHLIPEMRRELAEELYIWLTLCEQKGLHVDWLALQNEPDYEADYESCLYDPDQMAAAQAVVTDYLRHKDGFENLEMWTPDAANIGGGLQYTDVLLREENMRNYDAFAVHRYGIPYDQPEAQEDQERRLAAEVRSAGMRLTMTEYGNLTNTASGTWYEGWLEARHIMDALTSLSGSGWSAWQLWAQTFRGRTSGVGLVIYDDTNHWVVVTPKYYYVRPFYRMLDHSTTRIGSMVDGRSVKSTAFRDDDGAQILTLLNMGPATDVQIEWPGNLADSARGMAVAPGDTGRYLTVVFEAGQFNLHLADSAVVVLRREASGNGVEEEGAILQPSQETISIHPNPFNGRTLVEFSLSAGRIVTLSLFDVTGRWQSDLVSGFAPAGLNRVEFDGAGLPTGTYYLTLDGAAGTSAKLEVVK